MSGRPEGNPKQKIVITRIEDVLIMCIVLHLALTLKETRKNF